MFAGSRYSHLVLAQQQACQLPYSVGVALGRQGHNQVIAAPQMDYHQLVLSRAHTDPSHLGINSTGIRTFVFLKNVQKSFTALPNYWQASLERGGGDSYSLFKPTVSLPPKQCL